MLNKRRRRLANEVNAGSMADIAFLLLIFFLVTTTIVSDKGITVKLPPYEPDQPVKPLPEKNVFTVKVNTFNQLLVEQEEMEVAQLREAAKEFITNPNALSTMPSTPHNAIISLQNDRGTAYETYLSVYNELKGAYNELWEAKAMQDHQKSYTDLTAKQQNTIRKEIPFVISEAEPTEL